MPDRTPDCAGSPIPHGGPAHPGLWSGVDTPQAPHAALIQFDLDGLDLDACRRRLDDTTRRLRGLGFAPGFGAPGAPATYLVGISVRLVKGSWTPWRDDDDRSARWQRRVSCPPSLRTMQAKRDSEFPAFRTEDQRTGHETDCLVLLESADPATLARAVEQFTDLSSDARTHHGALLPEGRDPFGFHDGVSNLQHLREHAPDAYADHLLHRDTSGEHGTYLVFRRYRLYPQRMRARATLRIADDRGDPTRHLTPEQVVGRCRACGAVLDHATGRHLPPRPDESQAAAAHPQSHLHKAHPRGRGYTNFGHDVVVPDARILRRSYPTTAAPGDPTGSGLLFLAFQSDIQNSGFEFIHNEWLLSDFNGAPDPLLSPEAGLVEPLTGCYYFIPRDQADVAGALHRIVTTEPADDWDDD